jgi:hypothetical protein
MTNRSSVHIRHKITWGSRAILSSAFLLTLTLFAPSDVEAARREGEPQVGPLTQAERKLDRELRGKAAHNADESDVIVEFTDGGDDADVLEGFGKKGKRLAGMNGRVLRVPNGLLARLAEHPRVKRIHHDRPVSGDVARTAIAIGSRAVVALMGYTGAGVGVAVVDSGMTGWHDDLRIKG